MLTKKRQRAGRASLFRGKIRKPVTLTLTRAHHQKIRKNTERLDLTRADLLGLLIEKYADTVTKAPVGAYKKLRAAIEALGGTLVHEKLNEPRGGTWVLSFGSKNLRMPSQQSMRYPDLDACYQLKNGVAVSRTWEDHTDVIDPAGLARLLTRLASSESEGS